MDELDDSKPQVTFYGNGSDRWVKRTWARQCAQTILSHHRCQGLDGHNGDHWCYRSDGTFICKPHESTPQRMKIGCAFISPSDPNYRSPLEMSRYRYQASYEDIDVTDMSEIERLENGDMLPHESLCRPCTEVQVEELRQLGRLEAESERLRRNRATALKYRQGDLSDKSSIDDIKTRFDADVERFSNLETGQTATMDAPLAMQLITEAAVRLTPRIDRVLDIGCGAGNNTLKLKEVYGRAFAVDLLDLSQPMLERAKVRAQQSGIESVELWHNDFRDAKLPTNSYDVILAAAVLHHLRDDEDWVMAFGKILSLLKPGGSVWITDLVVQETVPIHELMWSRYADYLEGLGGPEYRSKVLNYIAREDSPRSVTFQLELLRRVGFAHVELLHKNGSFAAFGAWKE